MTILDRMLGLIRHQPPAADSVPAPQPIRVIRGGAAAPELCMLATDTTEQDLDGLHSAMGENARRVVQLKADGIRALYIDGVIVSREGVPLDCAVDCQPGLRRLEEAFGEPMFFDAEYVEEGGFTATLSAQRKGKGSGVLWLFDAMPMREWRTGGTNEPTVNRLGRLAERLHQAETPFVGLLNWWLLDARETRAKARELWALGYEGVVTKEVGAGYVRSRSGHWRRLKETVTHICPVVDVMPSDSLLKSVIVRSPDGPIRLSRGWDKATGALIKTSFDMGYEISAEVSYQLSAGSKRVVRGAKLLHFRQAMGEKK